MDSKQAIKLLHNNQYQKHLGNGEYDYIHPLTDAEAKAVESLIEWQERMIGMAIAEIQNLTGHCPIDSCCCAAEEMPCRGICPLDNDDEIAGACWRRWLEGGRGNEMPKVRRNRN